MTAHRHDWLRSRTARERRLLVVTGMLASAFLVWTLGWVVATDFARLQRRVSSAERHLASARALAGRLAESDGAAAPLAPLVSTVEAAAAGMIGVDRLASLDPDAIDGGGEQASARLVGVTLAELVRVLERLEVAGDRARELDLAQHTNDRTRYDVTVLIERRGPA